MELEVRSGPKTLPVVPRIDKPVNRDSSEISSQLGKNTCTWRTNWSQTSAESEACSHQYQLTVTALQHRPGVAPNIGKHLTSAR